MQGASGKPAGTYCQLRLGWVQQQRQQLVDDCGQGNGSQHTESGDLQVVLDVQLAGCLVAIDAGNSTPGLFLAILSFCHAWPAQTACCHIMMSCLASLLPCCHLCCLLQAVRLLIAAGANLEAPRQAEYMPPWTPLVRQLCML